MYGLGHGGIESMLLVAGLVTVTLIQVLALARTDLSTLPLTAEQRALAAQQLAAIAAQPGWAPLLGAWERLWTIPLHVALSLVVLQVFLRGSLRWLWLAILIHALVDLLAAGVTPILQLRGMPALLVPEAIVTVVGLLSLWAIWALRDGPDAEPELSHQTAMSLCCTSVLQRRKRHPGSRRTNVDNDCADRPPISPVQSNQILCAVISTYALPALWKRSNKQSAGTELEYVHDPRCTQKQQAVDDGQKSSIGTRDASLRRSMTFRRCWIDPRHCLNSQQTPSNRRGFVVKQPF